MVFRNSKSLTQRGTGICQGLLYCGRKYTSYNGCSCLSCNEICGPDYGCSCPDCYYTLSYILYSTGKMNCPKCKSMLLRLNLLNIKNSSKYKDYPNIGIICDICKNTYNQNNLPFMFCKKCDYHMCPNCAFSQITSTNIQPLPKINFQNGIGGGEGMIYCGRKYTEPNACICGSCDGYCGLDNGCPGPICDLILAYNIHLNSHMICSVCN